MENKIININKQELSKLEFKKVNKATRPLKKWELMAKLKAGLIKRKDGDGKVKIVINSARGLFSIRAAILMIGNDFVVLRGNIYIPIKSIYNAGI